MVYMEHIVKIFLPELWHAMMLRARQEIGSQQDVP
jgi:hypothetical protein